MLRVARHYFWIDRAAWLSCAGILLLMLVLATYEVAYKPNLGMTEMLAGIVPMFVGLVWAVALFSREFETKSIVWALGQDLTASRWFLCRIISPFTAAVAFGMGVWGVVEVSQLRSGHLGLAANMMSYSYVAGHAIYPAGITLVMVAVAALAGVVARKAIPAVAASFAVGLLVGTTGASWLNPLLPTTQAEIPGRGPDGSLLSVPGDVISSTLLDSGQFLVEYRPNSAFWQAQAIYGLMWLLIALLLMAGAQLFFRRASRQAM